MIFDRCTDYLVTSLTSYIKDSLEKLNKSYKKKKGNQLEKRLYKIIYELNLISSRLLLYCMPNICANLNVFIFIFLKL